MKMIGGAGERVSYSRGLLCTLATAVKGEESNPVVVPLYRRLSALGATGESLTKTVNQYFREGRSIIKVELESCVKQLRTYRRFHHALELMEWMEQRGINLSHSNLAIRVDLLTKTKGIDATEDYFNSLPDSAKNRFTYGALLNCYCQKKMKDEALALFHKMSQLNFASTLAYNNLMSLCMRLHEPDKVPLLVEEMREKNVSPDTFTYNILMNSLASLNNIEGVERTFKEMETRDSDKCDWTTYSNLAVIYTKAGMIEKAELALVQLEKKMNPRYRIAYQFLISLYARTSNLSEVHRVWNCLKSAFPKTTNMSYLTTLQALAKLDDFEGLKKCFKEWESTCSSYDIRLANILISAYLRRDMAKEAGLICEDAIKRGSGPDFRTQELFMDFFVQNHEWDLAFSCMEATISKVNNKWKPSLERISAFLKHFEEEKNVAGAEEFCKMLKKVDCLGSEAYRLLLSTYVAANKKEAGMRKRLEKENIEMSPEIEELLERVCV